MPASSPDALDPTVDTLIGALDKLVTQLKALNIYYDSKACKNANPVRGKAEDAPLRTSFDASMAAMKASNVALGAEQKRRDVETLARLKASGDLLAYNTKLALNQGENLLNLFGQGTDIKNAAKYVQGDALAAGIENTLVTQRELYATAKIKESKPDYGHEITGSSVLSLVGADRDLKQ